MQKEVEYIGGQLEDLGGKVETLEVDAERRNHDDDNDGDADRTGEDGEMVPHAESFGKVARPERKCRVNARNAPYSG